MARRIRGEVISKIVLAVVFLIALIVFTVHSFSWEMTDADVDYMSQLIDQGYTPEQAYDEIKEMHGFPDLYGTGGIDGICKYGTHNPNGPQNGGGNNGSSSTTKPAHTHTWSVAEEKDSDCLTKGYVKYACDCGQTKVGEKELGEHTYSTVEKTPATCKEYRKETYICSVCGDRFTSEFSDEGYADHIYIPTEDAKNPTCTESGLVHYVCNVCGDAYDEEVDALEHDYSEYRVKKEANCTDDGIKALFCTRCDEEKEGSEVVIPMRGHNENPKHEIVEPTLLKEGKETVSCLSCGEILKEITIPATGGIWVYVVPVAVVVLIIIALCFVIRKKKVN